MFFKLLFYEGVRLEELNWQLMTIFYVVDNCYKAETNIQTVCTSVNDGKHMKGSYHYQNLAADFSIRLISKEQASKIVRAVRKLLGNAYDVVLEDAHIHVEFDLRKYNLD